jgi:hypothetical protein
MVRDRRHLIEWLLIAILVLSYSSGILDLNTDRPLAGTEAEIFQSLDLILVRSVREYHKFPLWNPYIRAGQPYVADPFLHVYNPLATIPVLLFGVLDGFKIALFLSFLAAAFGMWWLADVMGIDSPARLWMALMYAFTGQIAARFLQGEYDFVLGAAWIPWAFAGLICTVRSRRKRFAALTALFLALLFFSGNVYYAYFMFFAGALFGVVAVVSPRIRPFLIAVNKERAKWIGFVGILALALIALQLLPLIQAWPYMSKESNPDLRDSQTTAQILEDYLSKDLTRADETQILPPEEFYAYVGPLPFFALLLSPLSLRRKGKRELVFFLLLLILVFLWIDVKRMPWADLYAHTSFLVQFRYPSRMLIYGSVAILVLAGAGIDSLWDWIRMGFRRVAPNGAGQRVGWVQMFGAGIISLLMIGSILDVYQANKARVVTWSRYEPPAEIMGWLADHDPGEYYVSNLLNWQRATIGNGIRYLDAWYGFGFHPPKEHMLNERPVVAGPKYVILGNDKQPPDPSARAVHRFEGHTIYELPNSLPFVWSAPKEALTDVSVEGELRAGEVTALTPVVTGPNSLQISARGDGESTLVLMSAYYPGWRVSVDGKPAPLRNVGGYLAADLRSGEHEYIFSYRPTPFYVGLTISLISLAIVVGLVARDTELDLSTWARRLRRRMRSGPLPAPPWGSRTIPSSADQRRVDRREAAPAASEPPGLLKLGERVLLAGQDEMQIEVRVEEGTRIRISIRVERLD